MPSGQPSVAVLLYPGCVFFEIALAAEILAKHRDVRYFTPDGSPIRVSNGARLEPTGSYGVLSEIDVEAVLVPGGDPEEILLPVNLARMPLTAQATQGALLAGICAGTVVLAACGVLHGRRATHNYTSEFASPAAIAAVAPYFEGIEFVRADIVQDGPFITCQPWAYRKFAATVARQLGVIDEKSGADLETYVVRRSLDRD